MRDKKLGLLINSLCLFMDLGQVTNPSHTKTAIKIFGPCFDLGPERSSTQHLLCAGRRPCSRFI
ncbi:hypothetical protein HanIR_Chr02g0094651 [Helianthus annuus]|nr:hypothetical protein HanIR_Chr02g0094651 [Helianthus annuus]